MIDDLIGKDLNMFTLIVIAILHIISSLQYCLSIKLLENIPRPWSLLSAVGVAIGMFMYGNQN
jgi:uncharacterized membrane protein YbhN (UPF0104 family)